MNEFVNPLMSLVTVWMSKFLGGFDGLIKAMLIFVLVEYITGIFCVILKKIPYSKIGIKEILKKLFMFMLVGIANTIDIYITNTSNVLRTIVILVYIAYIGKSILVNAGAMGVIVPSELKKRIKELGNEDDDSNKGNDEID